MWLCTIHHVLFWQIKYTKEFGMLSLWNKINKNKTCISRNFLSAKCYGRKSPAPTCFKKSCTMLCSDTWEPMANLLLSCFSILEITSWSSSEVKPSAPETCHIDNNKFHCHVKVVTSSWT